MGFSDKQVRALGRSVPADAIRTRMSSGKELTFIRILTQDPKIVRSTLDTRHGHATLDPALQRALLVQ